MAIAGGACSAYQCSLENGKLKVRGVTTLRSLCVDPTVSIASLKSGMIAIIAGSDMVELRRLLQEGGL